MKLEKLREKIAALTNSESPPVRATYKISDTSTQAEIRLRADWEITLPVDEIKFPKNVGGENKKLWRQMESLVRQIKVAGVLKRDGRLLQVKISTRTKVGPGKRADAKIAFEIEAAQAFLADYRVVTRKQSLAAARQTVSSFQTEQKALLPEMRRANAEYLAHCKNAKADERQADADALTSDRFWEASASSLKEYFHVPFDKRRLADISERWRAALFVECESYSYKKSYGWGHKLVGTGRGWLCGIDDNGDEWGHMVRDLYQCFDEYGGTRHPEGNVEDAMAELFGISVRALDGCTRQGDLLFCPSEIPVGKNVDGMLCPECGHTGWPEEYARSGELCLNCHEGHYEATSRTIPAVELHEQTEPWEVRESHRVSAPGLWRNGHWFRSDSEITVEHTSHKTVTLPAGSYRLYTLQVEDAD